MKAIIVGGGWSGCAAALSARKQGAQVVLIERTDMLLGTGLVGGIMRNNGRYTATEEMIAMGGGEIFQLTDQNSLHRNFDFPGHRHASLYNVATMEPVIRRFLLHVLPPRFMRIRHYGLLAPRAKGKKLTAARAALGQPPPAAPAKAESVEQFWLRVAALDIHQCPYCKTGRMRVVGSISRPKARAPPQRS